jgi:hypothetical protein
VCTAKRAGNIEPRHRQFKQEFPVFSFDLKLPATKWTIDRERMVSFLKKGYMLTIQEEPDTINKQDITPDKHQQDRPTTGADQ